MTRDRMAAVVMAALSALAAGGFAVAAAAPATASEAGYCGQGWNHDQPSYGVATRFSVLLTGPLISCDRNGFAAIDDFLYVECFVPENGGWYFVDDWSAGDLRGWIFSSNFRLTDRMPGRC